MTHEEQPFIFEEFLADEDPEMMEQYFMAAKDKLETLYPCSPITYTDHFSMTIESDSFYAPNGVDEYELGMVDEEYPALRRVRDGHILTFRV